MSENKLNFGTLKLSTMLSTDPTLSYDCSLMFITRLNSGASSIPTSSMLVDFENKHSEHIDTYHLRLYAAITNWFEIHGYYDMMTC